MLAKCLPRYFQEPTATSASNASQCLSRQSIDPLYLQHYLFPISIAAPQPFQLSNAPKASAVRLALAQESILVDPFGHYSHHHPLVFKALMFLNSMTLCSQAFPTLKKQIGLMKGHQMMRIIVNPVY
ncbi:hypothetical protein C365_03345 [Cryptococcus neoformans Bt85]|nr:hypothetical protein C365_03345 [Cryptococcus neoformans var. grubii Bt85]